jgi:hypothetical protein
MPRSDRRSAHRTGPSVATAGRLPRRKGLCCNRRPRRRAPRCAHGGGAEIRSRGGRQVRARRAAGRVGGETEAASRGALTPSARGPRTARGSSVDSLRRAAKRAPQEPIEPVSHVCAPGFIDRSLRKPAEKTRWTSIPLPWTTYIVGRSRRMRLTPYYLGASTLPCAIAQRVNFRNPYFWHSVRTLYNNLNGILWSARSTTIVGSSCRGATIAPFDSQLRRRIPPSLAM